MTPLRFLKFINIRNRKRGMEDVQWIFFIPVENRSQSTIIV